MITDYLEIAVAGGRLDLAIATRLHECPEELHFTPVGFDNVLIAAPKGHPLSQASRPLAMHELLEQSWALPRRESGLRRHIESMFAAAGLPRPDVRLENDFSASAYELIAECGLLTICTSYVLDMLPGDLLKALDVHDFLWQREIGIFTRQDAPASSLTQDLVGLLADTSTPGIKQRGPKGLARP